MRQLAAWQLAGRLVKTYLVVVHAWRLMPVCLGELCLCMHRGGSCSTHDTYMGSDTYHARHMGTPKVVTLPQCAPTLL